ncbi:Tn7-like element transposition protein TnsE [Brassicibacter mesophilus]|uniref:Tn7-like element transposition protein TnsE n=1 Tax=Brassicibacter mesophilus TaxID=745119 RepID=UPI003D25F191
MKLYWIDKPYKLDDKWAIDAYFISDKFSKKITLDWASIHFLAFGRYYTNENLNNSQIHKNAAIEDLNLNKVKFNLTQDFLNIECKEIKTEIFVGYKNGIEYRIPALEIIRAVIATNRFLLNRIVEIDSFTKYFVYKYDDENNLFIDFFDEYERKLLSGGYVRHLAWILTNENVLMMFNEVGKSLWLEGNIKYNFLFKEFDIKARIHKDKKVVRILEIMEFRSKKINANEIFIGSKYINEINVSSEPKLRKYKSLNIVDEKMLDAKIDGANNVESDFINSLNTNHIYCSNTKINRRKKGKRILRTKEDKNTQTYEIENDKLRTTADTGGLDKAKGLEYKDIDDVEIEGELEQFVEILKLIRKKPNIKDVQVIIENLPEGKKGKRFAYLSDRLNKRKYVIGEISTNNKRYNLIEIERQNRSLSILLLYSSKIVNWKKVYLSILLGLVNKSGAWDFSIINKMQKIGISSDRIRHISDTRSITEKAEYIYNKLNI